MARLTSAGVPDPGFGQDGEQTLGLASGPAQDVAHAVAIQANGAIVLAGSHATGLGGSVFALARINAQGMLDASFGNAGVRTIALSAGSQPADAANAMTLQPDGAIVVAGSAGNGYGVARLTSSGDLDTSFNQTGKYVLQFPASFGFRRAGANGVVMESDGKILVAGQVGAPHGDFGVIRLNGDGSLDAGFADRGERMIPFNLGTSSLSDDDDEANAAALTPDGKLVVAGYASLSGGGIQASARFAVARLLTANPGNSTPPSSPPSTPAPPTAPTSPTAPPSIPVAPSKPARPVTPAPAAPPLPPGFARTPPQIVGVRVLRARNGVVRIVLMLDQRIVARPALLRRAISVTGQGADGSYDAPGRILRESYNPRARSITLAMARRPSLSGSLRLTVKATGIVNLLGQSLDGRGDGEAGTDFLATIDLP